MKRTDVHRTFTAVTFAAACAASCGSPSPPAAGTASTAAPIPVTVTHPTAVDWSSYIEAGGTVQPRSTAHITSRVVASVVDVHVRPGDRVARGQRLLTLDARTLSAQAAQAAATLAAATEAARAATSRVVAAEATSALASATYARIDALHARRSATPQELDQALAARDMHVAQADAARLEQAAAEAARSAAEAGLQAASATASYAELTAPFDGIVTERLVDVGSLATPATTLLVVEESGPATLDVYLDDTRARALTVGQHAEVRLDASAAWVTAKVTEIARAATSANSFVVTVELPPDISIRTGTFGYVRFARATRSTLTVPSSSLIQRGQLASVFVVGTDGLVRMRHVRRGAVDDGRTEILAGLDVDDAVVTSPSPGLSDGQTRSVSTAPATESQP